MQDKNRNGKKRNGKKNRKDKTRQEQPYYNTIDKKCKNRKSKAKPTTEHKRRETKI